MRKLFLLFFFSILAYGKNVFSPKGKTAVWDIGGAGAITNGSGTWDTLSSQFTYETGVFNSPFAPGTNVSFGNPLSTGAGGTVTVSGTKLINGFIFDTGPTSDYTLSGGTLSCVNGSGCTFTSNQSGTIGSVITGSNPIIKDGTQTLTLSAANTYTGGTTVNGGTLSLNGGGGATTSTIKGNLTINSGGTVTARTQQWDMGYSENATEAVKLITINEGTLNFTGTNDTGGNNAAITMTNGSIIGSRFDVYRPSGARTITINAGTSTISAGIRHRIPGGLTFDVATGGTLNFSGIITQDSTAGDVIKAGPGLMNMTGVNTYTDNTTISGGTFQIGEAGSVGSGTYTGNISIASGATFKYSSSTNQTLSGVISGAGSLEKDTSTVSITLSNANTYTGSTTINVGQINVYAPSGLGSTSRVNIGSGATLSLNTNGSGQNYTTPVTFSASTGNIYFGQTDWARDNTWSGNIALTGNANITGNKSGGIARLTGIISGAGTLTLGYTAGTFYLSGNNTYTGGTTITVGTITCQHANALGTAGTITVNSGATLNKNATGCGGTRITCNGTCNN